MTESHTKTSGKSRTLNTILWISQILLGITLLYAAWMKLFSDRDALAAMWPWTAESPNLVTTAGIFDALGGLGMIIPGIVHLSRRWTAAAGIGIVLLMICAIAFHISRGEAHLIGFNIALAFLAGFVAAGRWSKKI